MVEMRHHPDRMMDAQSVEQFGVDALRQNDGDARGETDRFDACDTAQGGEYSCDAVAVHAERIAAAHDDVADVRMGAQVSERRLQALEGARPAAVADHATARTE